MTGIAIFGGAGSGAIAAESVRALAGTQRDIHFLGFLNDVLPGSISGAPILGPFASWRDLPEDCLFLAPLHKANAMRDRHAAIQALGIPAARWATIVDPRSAVSGDADIGAGCYVGPFATIGPAAKLGPHTAVRAGAHVSHDCVLGAFVFIGTNAVVSGFAGIGHGAYVGPGAIVRERSRLGAFSVVGAGSVVRKEVLEGEVVTGPPSRRVTGRTPAEDDLG